MFSTPEDPELTARMHAAHTHAAQLFGCVLDGPARAWGYRGRSLGGPVQHRGQPCWLRVLSAPPDRAGGKLWTGTTQARTLFAGVPRPELLAVTSWADDDYTYQAELTERVADPVCSPTPDLTAPMTPDEPWWTALQDALDRIAGTEIPASRESVISQEYIHRAIPRYLGTADIDTTVRRWTLAHGDLHWANLTAARLVILDWEGFGPAPAGFDAANLHAYTLAVPGLATQIQHRFADVLDSADGQLAQLTTAAMILQAAERDPVHARLAPHVRTHVTRLFDSRHDRTAPPERLAPHLW